MMGEDITILEKYSEYLQSLADGKWKAASLSFDRAERQFDEAWGSLFQNIANKPEEAPQSVSKFIAMQPEVIGLTLAMTRCNRVGLFRNFKRFLELILRKSSRMSGYPAISGIPNAFAGFLYMISSVMALNWESWGILEKLLADKFEWRYHSDRAIFDYGFDVPPFFHSETFGRSAARIHDFYKGELVNPQFAEATWLSGDEAVDKYVQTQLLMSLRVAQLAQKGEDASIWPDFGRYYSHRVVSLFDHAYADPSYAEGLVRGFGESPEDFFKNLNSRLQFIQSNYWGQAPYFYESIVAWEPR
jgi:hypothetical protein